MVSAFTMAKCKSFALYKTLADWLWRGSISALSYVLHIILHRRYSHLHI